LAVAEVLKAGDFGDAVLNRATTFQPWIQLARCDAVIIKKSFNGATTFQPWILQASISGCLKGLFPFQWGHDFSAMDTVVRQRLLVDPANKFQWGHDFSAMDT